MTRSIYKIYFHLWKTIENIEIEMKLFTFHTWVSIFNKTGQIYNTCMHARCSRCTRVNANIVVELGGFYYNNWKFCKNCLFDSPSPLPPPRIYARFQPESVSRIKWIFVLLRPNTFNIAFPWIYVNLINFVRSRCCVCHLATVY